MKDGGELMSSSSPWALLRVALLGLVSIVGHELEYHYSFKILVTDHTRILRSTIIEKRLDSQNVDPLIFIPLQFLK